LDGFPQGEKKMTEEIKATETAQVTPAETKPVTNDTITVNIDGVDIPDVPLALAKQLIEKRQAAKKEVTELRNSVAAAEARAKSEGDKAQLLKAMKDSDVDAVRGQVAGEYLEKISNYERKIFSGEVKSLLASEGTLAGALDDATNLALSGAKLSLVDGNVQINDKPASEFVKSFIQSRPHLLSVKASTQSKAMPKAAVRDSGFTKFAVGIFDKK